MADSSSSSVAFEGVAMFCVLLCDDAAAAVGIKLQKNKQVHVLPSASDGEAHAQPGMDMNSPRHIRH